MVLTLREVLVLSVLGPVFFKINIACNPGPRKALRRLTTKSTVNLCGGLPGQMDGFLHQRFFYLLMCIGQLHNRLIKPYLAMPFRLAGLVDLSRSEEFRLDLARELLHLPNCCLEQNFAKPVLDELRKEHDLKEALLPGHQFFEDLSESLRMKTANLEIELNFARAVSMRTAMRGRKHSISSLTAKHVGAEVKQGQRRKILNAKRKGKVLERARSAEDKKQLSLMA